MSENRTRNWSMDEIDNLLSRTEKDPSKRPAKSAVNSKKEDIASVMENFAKAERFTGRDNDRRLPRNSGAEAIKKIFDSEEPEKEEKAENPFASDRTAKQRVADAVKSIKDSKKDKPEASKAAEKSAESDLQARILDEINATNKAGYPDGKTKVIERPGFVVKRGRTDAAEGLEEAPKIVDADAAKTDKELFREKETDAPAESWSDDQIKLYGFDIHNEDKPEKTTEEAEKGGKKNRRSKADNFKLKEIAEAEESSETDWNIEKLFAYQQTSGKKAKTQRVNNAGVEYTRPEDAARIRATLAKLKQHSFIKLAGFTAITAIMLLLNIISCTTAGYDGKALQIINFILLVGCIVLGINTVNSGIINAFKRKCDLRSAVAAASLAAVVQNICVFVSGIVLDRRSFVVSACAAAVFAFNEYGEYLRHSRTCDAFNFCTGKNKNNLYSIQEIENKGEKAEIGRNLHMKSPDVRYSCRAKFPARLIEQCESNVSTDKLQNTLLPVAIACSVVCGLLGGIVAKDFLSGVTAWAGAMCVCVPSFGAAAIQLPMRWANKRLNKTGGLITGQDAIENYSKTNAVVLDSADLFDRSNCVMHGFKHFNRVRVDDIMLYSAAMVVRSGGPLSEVFDQVVSKRDLLPEVSSFSYEDRMGISGWINSQKVIMGNRDMMRHHNLEIGDEIDEEKYTHDGRKVIYLAIDNSLAAMLVVSYAPNKKLIPFIKRLGDDGVSILLRNNDSNITVDMINETFGMKFNNISLINNAASRLYKKYRSRVRESAKSGIIHDGKALSLMRSFTMSYSLCGTFKVENFIQLINVIAGFAVTAFLALLKVFSVAGMWPLVIFQVIMALACVVVARLRGIF